MSSETEVILRRRAKYLGAEFTPTARDWLVFNRRFKNQETRLEIELIARKIAENIGEIRIDISIVKEAVKIYLKKHPVPTKEDLVKVVDRELKEFRDRK